MSKSFKELVNERRSLHVYHDKIYGNMMEGINSKILKTQNLKEDINKQFLEACATDISGEIIRGFFDMSDYNLTADQLFKRIVNFRYDNEYDPLDSINQNKKNTYNLGNSNETLMNINRELENSRIKLFEKENKKYKDQRIIQKGKADYRGQDLEDELGNADGNRLDVDHQQPLATAQIYTKFLRSGGVDNIKMYYNSPDNFGMLGRTANQCKGDAKVTDENGEDITYRATPEQLTEAIVKKLEGGENRKDHTTEKLQNDGILDENGKVFPHVKRKIKEDIKKSQNSESVVILKNTDYTEVAKSACQETSRNLYKILAGHILYYLTPPLIYELKINLNKNLKIESILEKLEESGDRIIKYISSKKSEIMLSLGEKTLKKMLKNMFDILISMIKATIKKIMKIIRQLVITSIDAIKIMFDKNKTKHEKMDAILQLVSGLIVSIVCEVLFEYIEKQFGIPEMFLMPLQMLTTIISSNFVMISLQELDLFSVRYGYKIDKIQDIFNEEQDKYDREFKNILESIDYSNSNEMLEIEKELIILKKNILENDIFRLSIKDELKTIKNMFDLEIDLEAEWKKFLNLSSIV